MNTKQKISSSELKEWLIVLAQDDVKQHEGYLKLQCNEDFIEQTSEQVQQARAISEEIENKKKLLEELENM